MALHCRGQFFFAQGNCANRRKKWDLSPTSTGSQSTRRSVFLLEKTVQIGGKKWDLSPTSTGSPSTRRQLEVRLPDVMAIFLFLLEEFSNQLNKGDLKYIRVLLDP